MDSVTLIVPHLNTRGEVTVRPFLSKLKSCGSLDETASCLNVQWKVSCALPEDSGKFYKSPGFLYSDGWWCLEIWPNGSPFGRLKEWIGLYLLKYKGPPQSIGFSFGVEMEDETKSVQQKTGVHASANFNKITQGWGYNRFLKKTDLLNAKSKITVVSCMLTSGAQPFYDGTRLRSFQNLGRNFLDILESKKGVDVVLNVQGCEIPAHRLFLQARSSVFDAMFAHDMDENRTGVVKIDDVEPDVFRCVLSYIYSGVVEGMSAGNVRSIFVAADKYVLQELKELCIAFMEVNLSVDLICDVLVVAHTYGEVELKNISKRYFEENSDKILKTEKWSILKIENADIAFELIESMIKKYPFKMKFI